MCVCGKPEGRKGQGGWDGLNEGNWAKMANANKREKVVWLQRHPYVCESEELVVAASADHSIEKKNEKMKKRKMKK